MNPTAVKASVIPLTADNFDEFTPPSLKGAPNEYRFAISIPTPSERDRFGSRMFGLGLQPITQEQIRATLIDEVFKLHGENGEDKAEEIASFLDAFWQQEEVDEAAMAAWQEQERERVLDEANGAPARPAMAMPHRLNSVRSRSRAILLVNEYYQKSRRLAALSERQINFGLENDLMMARIHIQRCVPKVETAPVLKLETDGEKLTEESIDRIRSAIGQRAWNELVRHIDGLYSLEKEEEGNFDSPPGKQSDQTGSPEPSGASEGNSGSSTTLNISPARDDASATITGKSSDTISPPDRKNSSPGLTDEDSPTSPSA